MKLYATVTSERASKGQGGNKFIVVEFKAGDRVKPIAEVQLYLHDDMNEMDADSDNWVLSWRNSPADDWNIIKQGHIKGNNQKGDCLRCAGDIGKGHICAPILG